MTSQHVDLLAIAAHRDDVELTCGGTLIKMARAGYKTAILDLTGGETGTRGSKGLRAAEAAAAAKVLGVTERANAGLPDAHLHDNDETRRIVVKWIRHFHPTGNSWPTRGREAPRTELTSMCNRSTPARPCV